MKRALLIVLLFLSCISSFAQKIHFTDSTNEWHVIEFDANGPSGVNTSYYLNDTIIHGKHYRQITTPFPIIYNTYIREDTLLNKVFAIAPISDTDTTEQILYDYTLQLGDTFTNNVAKYHVSSVDSVQINSIWHRIWTLQLDTWCGCIPLYYPYNNYTIVEGIGCLESRVGPIFPAYFEGSEALICFNNRGTTPPLSDTVGTYFDNSTSCSLTFGLAVNRIINESKNAILFPNPIDKTTKIVFPNTVSNGTMIIINELGQQIVNMSFKNKKEIEIGDKNRSTGIYYYRVTDSKSGKIYSGKFVQQ